MIMDTLMKNHYTHFHMTKLMTEICFILQLCIIPIGAKERKTEKQILEITK